MKRPRLPPPLKRNPLAMAGRVIQDAASGIDELAGDLDKALSSLGQMEEEERAGAEESKGPEAEEALASVTNQATLAWQLDHLLDDVLHLEVDHLPQQGRINGQPCDCIAKGGRETRRHAMETVPIAARQGVDAALFVQIGKWANHLIDIGSLDAVQSGKYEAEYLQQSGTASNFRKLLEKMLAELKKGHREHCETCPSILDMRAFIDRRRKEEKV